MPRERTISRLERAAFVAVHVVSGLYAGACLGIARVDLPAVRAQSGPDAMLALFQTLLRGMGQLMLPQLLAISLLVAILFSRLPGPRRAKGLLPLLLLGGIWAVTLSVHVPINRRILSGDVSAEVLSLAVRWEQFHWLRTSLAIALPAAIAWRLRPVGGVRRVAPSVKPSVSAAGGA